MMRKSFFEMGMVVLFLGLLISSALAGPEEKTGPASEPFQQGVAALNQGNAAAAAEKFTEALKARP